MSVDVVVITITREEITINAHSPEGSVAERYQRIRRATIQRTAGDFASAPICGEGDDEDLSLLLHDLIALGSPVREIQERLNKP